MVGVVAYRCYTKRHTGSQVQDEQVCVKEACLTDILSVNGGDQRPRECSWNRSRSVVEIERLWASNLGFSEC